MSRSGSGLGRGDVDASNPCIPGAHPLVTQVAPLPLCVRGEPACFDGKAGRCNSERAVLMYSNGRLIVSREVCGDGGAQSTLVYRGHSAQVSCCKWSTSGSYVASGDVMGRLRVWAYDNEEHLCKLELPNALTGPLRDVSWDGDSKRLCIAGEGPRSDVNSEGTKVIQWDSGVSCGDLGQHLRNRTTSCTFRPVRPMRIVTGGGDDSRCLLNGKIPFERIPAGTLGEDVTISEQVHTKGCVYSVRYSPDGSKIASVGTDKSVALYEGTNLTLRHRQEAVHSASIYACDWDATSRYILTGSTDGTVKMLDSTAELKVVREWNVALSRLRHYHPSLAAMPRCPVGAMVMSCAFVQGRIPAAVCFNGELVVLPTLDDPDDAKPRFITGHSCSIAALDVDPENQLAFTADTDSVICQWKLPSLECIGRLHPSTRDDTITPETDDLLCKQHAGTVSGLTLSGANLQTVGWDDYVRFPLAGKETDLKLDAQPNAIVSGTSLSVIMTVKGLVLLKDNAIVSSGGIIEIPCTAESVAISKSDDRVYVGGQEGNIYVFAVGADSSSLDLIHTISNGHNRPVYSLALSNDGTKLASADVRDVCVWDIATWETIIGKGRWCFHTQRITSLSWSPNDVILASGAHDDSIYLWCLDKKVRRVSYGHCHRGGITALSFIGENYKLLSTGMDGCLVLWDVEKDVKEKFGL